MKKIFAILMSIAILCTVFLFGCDFTIDLNGLSDDSVSEIVGAEDATADEIKTIGLGKGINAITGTYLDLSDGDTLKTGEIVDYNKLAQLGISRVTTQSGELVTVTGNSIEEYMSNIKTKYSNINSLNLGINISDLFGFTAGFSNKIALSSGFSITEKTVQYYYTSYQYYNASRCYITNSNAETLRNNGILNQSIISQLDNMKKLTSESLDTAIMNMFNSYGTHIIIDAILGGKIEIYYSQCSNSSDITSESVSSYEQTIKAGMNASYSAVSGNASAETTSSYDEKLNINVKNNTTYTNFNIRSYGGSAFNSSSFSDLGSAYKDWIDDFNNQTAKETMIDVAAGGLVAIWDLLSDEYSDIADRMKELFTEELAGDNSEFFSRFEVDEEVALSDYSVTLTRKSCALDNGFNPSESGSDNNLNSHKGFDLVSLTLSDCQYGGKLYADSNLSFKFKLLQSPGELPINAAMGWNWYMNTLSTDSFSGTVYGTNISGETIGSGAYYFKLNYSDGSSDEFNATDFLNGMEKGDEKTENITVDKKKTLSSVEIVVVYEIYYEYYANFVWYKEYSNWRLSSTLTFSN